MKRISLLILTALFIIGKANAQLMDITLKDKSVITYKVSDVEAIEFSEEPEKGEIMGKWYLGYRTTSSTATPIHYDGTECLSFKGKTLTWTTASAETVYTLDYADDKRTFVATTSEGKTENYTVVAYEVDMLVLKRASTTRYFYKSPEAAHNAVMETFPNHTEYTDVTKVLALKSGSSKSTITPMGKHFENRKTASDSELEYLADPKKQPTIQVESFNRWTAKTVNLYPFGEPKPADINQHAIGDCSLCAVLASLAYMYPDYIQHIVTQVSATHYTVDMFDPKGNPVQVAVDNKVLCENNGNIAQLTGKNNAITWGTIVEKAIMKWESVYECNGIGGIGTEHVAPLLTGCGDSFAMSPGKLYPYEMKLLVEWAMEKGMVSVGGFNKGDLLCGTLTSVTGHAFSVMYTNDPDNYLFSMRNPWGITSCDGVLEIPNRNYIIKTIDFRLVYPGAAEPYKRKDLGGYSVPHFIRQKDDLGVSKSLLQQYGLESYGPQEAEPEDDIDE